MALVLLAACGGGAARPAPVGNALAAEREVDVYATDDGERIGLYCVLGSRLTDDGCHWATALDGHARKDYTRVDRDGHAWNLASYGDDAGLAPVVAVPDTRQVPVPSDTTFAPDPRDGVEPDLTDTPIDFHASPLAAFDLDGDGVAEVVYRGTVYGSTFVAVVESGGFSRHVD